jgi:hypothetical protein
MDNENMRIGMAVMLSIALSLTVTLPALPQNTTEDQHVRSDTKVKKDKKGRSAGGDVASGSGNIAGGAAKGAGHAAEGVGKGAADLVTLHPIDAATDVSKGGASAGKDAAVGTTKGTAKIIKGIGRGIKHIF